MEHTVFWFTQRPRAASRSLRGSLRADVVIVGGGVAGLSCARRLTRTGRSIVLLERDFCGAGASGRSSGFITPDSELALASLVARLGAENARRLWSFVESGVETIAHEIRSHGFECDHRPQDSLFVAATAGGRNAIEDEHRARVRLGFASRMYEREQMDAVLHTSRCFAAVRYGGTFGIDPYAYCRRLRDQLRIDGVDVYEHTNVVRLSENGVETSGGSVTARHVIVCADRFIPALGELCKELYHVQTFLAATRPLAEADLQRIFADGEVMVWNTRPVYDYFRVIDGRRLLLGGGSLRHTYDRAERSDPAKMSERMLARFRRAFPTVNVELECAWSGMLGVSKDLLPLVGPDARRTSIWYVGGAAGLPWATALGIYVADRIDGAQNELDELFSPQRAFPLGRVASSLLSTPLTYALSHGIVKYGRGRQGA